MFAIQRPPNSKCSPATTARPCTTAKQKLRRAHWIGLEQLLKEAYQEGVEAGKRRRKGGKRGEKERRKEERRKMRREKEERRKRGRWEERKKKGGKGEKRKS